MKRKLLKSLLLAAAMLVESGSAWGVDYPYSVGTSTSDTWFSHVSPVYSLSSNGIIDITFTNHCATSGNNWENWLLVCGKSTDTQVLGGDDANRYFIMRADRWDDINGGIDGFCDAHFLVSSDYWTDYKAFQNEATIKLHISRVGTLVTVNTTVSKSGSSRQMSYFYDGVGESENLQFYLTQNLSYLTIDSEPVVTTTITAQDYTNGVADWTSGNTTRYTVDMTTNGANKYLAVNAVSGGNNGATITGATLNGKVAAGTDFASSNDYTLFFDMILNGGSGNNAQPSWFHINDASNNNGGLEAVGTHLLTLFQGTAGSTSWQINGNTTQTVTMSKDTWYSFQLSKKGSQLYLTVKNTNTGADVLSQQLIAVNSTVGGLGNMIFQTKRYYSGLRIDNIVLRNWVSGDTPEGVATSYTIRYRNESDEEIKSDIVMDGLVGDEVSATALQMADIIHEGQKYIYKEGNDGVTLVADAASNVITLVYREAATYTYRLSSSLGTVIVNSSNYEGNTVYVPYPKYELSDSYLYEAVQGNTGWYEQSYTLTDNVDDTKNYNKTAISNVVFYVEGENIVGAASTNANNANIRNSNGKVGWAAGTAGENDLVITTLPAGSYQIVANLFTASSGGGTSTFKLGTNTFNAVGNASSYNTLRTSDVFTINENTDLVLQAGGGDKNAVDFVYVIKTAVPVTISAAGWATLYTPYALDFSSFGEDFTAYTATLVGSTVKLTAVNDVPANTGVVLNGTAGTYNIPVAASSETAKGDLEGNATEATAYGSIAGKDLYYLALNGEGDAQFTKLNEGGSIAAGKAFLPVTAGSLVKAFTVIFNDADAIGDVRSKMEDGRNEIFNLAGQRLSKAQKGINIVNGKKVLVK